MSKALRAADYLGHILQAVAAAFAAAHAHIPWQVMYTMRNRVSHGYEQVDLEIVWRTIQGDLPVLHQQVQQALASLQAQP